MTSEYLLLAFKIGNALILPFWALLFVAPRSKLADRFFGSRAALLVLALLYSVVVVPVLATNPSALSALLDPTLPGVQELLSTDGGAVAGWIHFLCFDLFVAAEIRERALKRGHAFYWVSPIFFAVLMLGPLGWLIFEIVSWSVMRLKSRQFIKINS